MNVFNEYLKNNTFYILISAHEYRSKTTNNKSTFQLNEIPTFLITYYEALN
jgi:hypothetical protein